MRVAAVENTKISNLGQVGVALDEAGAEITVFKPWNGEALPQTDDGFDALVVLGGEQSALDDHTHPYLPQLAALMRRFGDAGKAVLGICLGSQVLARAYGGENLLGKTPEFGWHTVSLTPDGEADPVLSAVSRDFSIFEWHSDTFTLPPGAAHLAANGTATTQAFRVGRAAYGTQFHFEANRDVVEEWREGFPDAMEECRPGWLAEHRALAQTYGPAADAAGLALARAWVRQIEVADRAAPAETAERLAGE